MTNNIDITKIIIIIIKMQPYPSAHKTDQMFVEFLCEGLFLLVHFSQYERRLAKVPLYSVDCPLT